MSNKQPIWRVDRDILKSYVRDNDLKRMTNLLLISQFDQLVAFDLSVRADITMIKKPLTDTII